MRKWQLPDGNAPDSTQVEFASWESNGKEHVGMRKISDKKRHGFVRSTEPEGAIVEATYKDGVLHGYYTKYDKNGVMKQIMKEGCP